MGLRRAAESVRDWESMEAEKAGSRSRDRGRWNHWARTTM